MVYRYNKGIQRVSFKNVINGLNAVIWGAVIYAVIGSAFCGS